MIVSAVNINGLEKMEQMEHLFNDVKYATISLDKEMKQIKEQFDVEILKLNIKAMKQRLLVEYSEFMKPTYEFLQLDEFPLYKENLEDYLSKYGAFLKLSCQRLQNIVSCIEQLSEFGLVHNWTYQNLMELILLFDSLSMDMEPTKYWFDLSKYDFMQELLNETQTKVEEYQTAMKRLTQSWSLKVLEPEQVAALDYYMERKSASFKLFDLTFHKSKKMLKDLYVDENRTFQDCEIENLEKYVYTIKRNGFWISKNMTRIQQFWGEGYQELDTEFAKLRGQYAIAYKISSEYTIDETRNYFVTTMIETHKYMELVHVLSRLKEELYTLQYKELIQALPCEEHVVFDISIELLERTLTKFVTVIGLLHSDITMLCNYRLPDLSQEEFSLEDMRKLLYSLERVMKKQEWLRKYQAKIREVFRNEEITLETDWNALKDRFFRTDMKDSFPTYIAFDSGEVVNNCKERNLLELLKMILEIECPMKEELLYRRVVQGMGLTRMTPKLKMEIKELLDLELSEEYEQEDEFIYSKKRQDLQLRIYKAENNRRDIDSIAPRELKAGIMMLLKLNYEMTLDEISKEMASLLQYPRRSKKLIDIVEKNVKELKKEEKIRRYSGGFRIESYCIDSND